MQGQMKVGVVGATGRVGRHVVDLLRAGGHAVVPMSRSSGVDVVTGEGLAAALMGVECVIDAANGSAPDQESATAFFTTAARTGDSLRVEGVSDPADPDHDRYAAGALLPGPDAILTGPTFPEWLDATVGGAVPTGGR